MSSAFLISTSPPPLPSPTSSIRPSKLELLRLLREQREREQLGAQALSAQSTPSASSVSSVSGSNALLPSNTPEVTQESKINMGAILGGLAGGVLLLAIILVAIIVPLQRRRSLRKAVAGVPVKAVNSRRLINLDLPWGFGGGGEGGKDEERGGEGQGEKDRAGPIEGRRTYPTMRSGTGTHKTTGSEVPLLDGSGGGSGGNTPTRSGFGENGSGRLRLDHPQGARHPAQSSTHVYEDLPLSSPTELDVTHSSRGKQGQQRQQPGKHDDLWFYYRTNSTAAPPLSNKGTVKSGTAQAGADGGGAQPEFDPYSPFDGTPSPLDGAYGSIVQPSIALTSLERPAPAAAPSSPKKATRDLPLPDTSPFIDVELNGMTTPNVASVGTANSANFGTGKSSVDIYTCIDNPFMTPFERNQGTNAYGNPGGGVTTATAQGGGSWFSYHSSSVRSGPHSRPAPLPPTFLPSISTSPTELANPNRLPSPDTSEPDSASVYSQMSLSRSGTAMSVNGSIIRYGSVRAHAAENGGSGFMPVVLEAKEDTPTTPSFPRDSSTVEGPITAIIPASPPGSVEDDDPTPKATPASSANARVSLARMDTLAIGNLIKSRAKRVAMERSPSDVERIERQGSMGESEGGSEIRNDAVPVHQVTKELETTAVGSTKQEEEEPVVRGRGVRREEVEGAADYGAIPRAPVKRTSSDQALGRSRSQSRGRLVPKASLQRMRGGSSDNEGAGGSEEGANSGAKPPIGRSPSKYRPKGLQQRLVEKGLLNMGGTKAGRSRSASREGKERVRPRTTSVPTSPIDLRVKAIEVKKQVEVVVGQDDGEGPSSAVSTPSPSPAKSKGKNKNKKNLLIRKPPPSNLDSDVLSPPQEQTKAAERVQSFAANPLTGAFGLGQPPGVRSPATPTFQYAFAELERAKGFFPKVEGLNVSGTGKKKGGK